MSLVEPSMIIIFGAVGDLSKRKLMPALFSLFRKGQIDEKNPIVGIVRKEMSREEFFKALNFAEFIPKADPEQLSKFQDLLHVAAFDSQAEPPEKLAEAANRIAEETQCGPNRVVYLALPAEAFGPTAVSIDESKITGAGGWRRICFEKPFGFDLASAHALNREVTAHFQEKEIYRIDHYLGKELVRNMLVLRFANPLFDLAWNRTHVDHMQITIAETLGVEGRGGYYEKSGAVRDMIQNHMLQVLALATMEPPSSLDPEAIRDEKTRLIRSVRRPTAKDLVIGQYGPGEIDKKAVPGYREEQGVKPDSTTETFAALKLHLDGERWRGVPIYLRTGKRMEKKYAEINVVLRDTACELFCGEEIYEGPNVITIRVQPYEGVSVTFNVKEPGEADALRLVTMEHCHHCLYGINTPEAYEILLLELLEGDQTLFTRWDFVEISWRLVDHLFDDTQAQRAKFPNYPAGSGGPAAADKLLARDDRAWLVSKDIVG